LRPKKRLGYTSSLINYHRVEWYSSRETLQKQGGHLFQPCLTNMPRSSTANYKPPTGAPDPFLDLDLSARRPSRSQIVFYIIRHHSPSLHREILRCEAIHRRRRRMIRYNSSSNVTGRVAGVEYSPCSSRYGLFSPTC
jgi:hypothetical protein